MLATWTFARAFAHVARAFSFYCLPAPDVILNYILRTASTGGSMKDFTFNSEAAASLLDLMSHAGRLSVLKLISVEERDVKSLAEAVGMSSSALSQHLKKLREGKLVKARRDAQTVYYSVTSDSALRILSMLEELALDPQIKKRRKLVRNQHQNH